MKTLDGITEAGPALLPLDAGEQYRFTFAMESCIGCHSCEIACAEQNDLPIDVSWRRVGEVEGGAYPATKRFHLSMACNHCLEPSCLQGCPTEAYVKLDSGIVAHLADECIGCQYCTWNCPYSVPVFDRTRRIVSKCDMCQPRIEAGLTSACVAACPTHAIGIEKVDVAAWRADHRSADGPNLPSSSITLSTTRLVLPGGMPMETFAASDHHLAPEEPHWPLVWVTLLTQIAAGIVGASLLGDARSASLVGFAAVAVALPGSLLHLGRPLHAFKALRNLRRSWLSREVLAFMLFALAAGVAALWPTTGVTAVAFGFGVGGVVASGRLYVVPGRPAWNTPLTIAAFIATGAAIGPLVVATVVSVTPALRATAVIGLTAQLLISGALLVRAHGSSERELHGTWLLSTGALSGRTTWRWILGTAAVIAAVFGPAWLALAFTGASELLGRHLFYVSVVPLNMPGGFFRAHGGRQ